MLLSNSDQVEKDWFENTARVFSERFEKCGCPYGLSLQKRGKISELFTTLPNEDENGNLLVIIDL